MNATSRTEVLRFRANPREGGARLVSALDGALVLLDRYHPRTTDVNEGETWRCILQQKSLVWIASPIERIDPPPRATSALPAPDRSVDEQVGDEQATLDASPPGKPGPRLLSGVPLPPAEVLHAGERLAVFVDGSSTEAAADRHDWIFDWPAILDHFAHAARFGGAFYYAPPTTSERTLSRLARAEFNIRVTQGDVSEAGRSLLVQLATDAAMRGKHFESAFIFTSDPAYRPLIEGLQGRGKRVHVVADLDALPSSLAHLAELFSLEDFSLLSGTPTRQEAGTPSKPRSGEDET